MADDHTAQSPFGVAGAVAQGPTIRSQPILAFADGAGHDPGDDREATLAEQPDPLSALVGRTRATLLAALALPSTTTQLAAQLELSPAAVSQHLKILKDTALVSAHRRGRMVLYQRTPAATTLLETIRSHEDTG